ncbi:MAG: 4-alpha-glucanotransferase [Polyangia bacterium]
MSVLSMPLGASLWPRHSGLLLHITSLPGPGGCGDLGPEAHRFIERLVRARQRAWQVLPIGPTGFGDSPYQTASVQAGSPLLVSPQRLVDDGLLSHDDLRAAAPVPPSDVADFEAARAYRGYTFERAHEHLLRARSGLRPGLEGLVHEHDRFCAEERDWLEDWALFAALKEEQAERPWIEWPAPLRDRDPAALHEARARLAGRMSLHRFVQWQFDRQWRALRSECRAAGIELIGDVPIFVAHDSVEVWQDRRQFLLHPDGRQKVQAGVPPDYFSRTGQLWGNPLYDYATMEADGFSFWRRRIRRAARLFDRVRIDHFRGFAAHWEVPGDARTAEHGRWIEAPGAALFEALLTDPETRSVRFIAEDLGIITPDVEELRDRFGLPGIRVLVFGFGDDDHYDGRPWGFRKNSVVYTTTHDNATIAGWYRGEPEGTRTPGQAALERKKVQDYLGYVPDDDDAHFALIRLALSCTADTVIIPVQDVLGLGNSHRMNRPGVPEGNWKYRLLPGQLDDPTLDRLRHLTELYGRAA